MLQRTHQPNKIMKSALKTIALTLGISFTSAFADEAKNSNFSITVPKETLFASVAEVLDVCKAADLTIFTLRTTMADTKNVNITLTASDDNSTKIVGNYVCHLYDPNPNEWHFVTVISMDDGTLKWTNRAGASWKLTPTADPATYSLGSDCPYYERGVTTVDVCWDEDHQNILSFVFQGEAYSRDAGTPAPQ